MEKGECMSIAKKQDTLFKYLLHRRDKNRIKKREKIIQVNILKKQLSY